jgi:hypothetical protein
MKLAIVLAAVLAFPSLAGAEILNPPSGPVVVDDEAMMDGEAEAMPVRDAPMRRGDRMGQQRDPRVVAKRQQLRRALIAQFDVNGDGRLGPRERVRAARVLRRIENRLTQPMKQQRGGQYRRFMRRYDINGDGQVGPREMPSGAADRLRPLDRDRDGWVDPSELR